MTADNHIHTRFSPDGKGDPEEFVLAAIARGMRHVVFTEHVDLLYCQPQFVMGDLDVYFSCVRALQKKYAHKLYVGAGLEVGYTPQNKTLNKELLQKYRPDYVIGSVHQVGDNDCYFAAYFKGKTATKAYGQYLQAVRESLDAPYDYNTVGHIGYVCRNAPYNDLLCPEHAAAIDDILKTIIRKGKVLEINTSCNKPNMPTVPEREIVLRYARLGGKKLCFASDAHTAEDIGRNYEVAKALAADAGIYTQTVFEHGKEVFYPF